MMRAIGPFLLSCVVGILIAAEADVGPNVEGSIEALEELQRTEHYDPEGRDNRRDIFFDLIEKRKAEIEAARQQEDSEKDETALPGVGEIADLQRPGDDDGVYQAEEYAKQVTEKVRQKFLGQKWQQVMSDCTDYLRELKGYEAQYPDSEIIANAIHRVRNYKIQAEEKYRYELAKAEFDALNILIEGIIWSAEGDSLALINDEAKAVGVNDKVRNDAAVVVSIDRNRVDFMVVQDATNFHFQRYIEDE